jgi:hypothetical protein
MNDQSFTRNEDKLDDCNYLIARTNEVLE